MKLFSTILLILCTYQYVYSQAIAPNQKAEVKTTITIEEKKEEVIQQLFNIREEKEFALAIDSAKNLGVSNQSILEATFLYHIDQAEFNEVIKITEEFQKITDTFDPKDSKIFSTKEDLLSVIEYGHALKALEEKNIPLFKKHIQEAFWLSPNQAGGFAPHINQLHISNAMMKVQLKLDQKIFQVNADDPISFNKMLEEKDALLLRFWSPWSRQVEQYHPLTVELAKQCAAHKVSFASILINKEPQGIKDTLKIIQELGEDLPSYWLADEDNGALTKLLRITNLPTIVLISKEGKILYNGTLENKELWNALSKINPDIKAND